MLLGSFIPVLIVCNRQWSGSKCFKFKKKDLAHPSVIFLFDNVRFTFTLGFLFLLPFRIFLDLIFYPFHFESLTCFPCTRAMPFNFLISSNKKKPIFLF